MSQQMQILAVDDEPRGVELLARTLRGLGTCLTATSGEEAWELIQHGEISLVISDQRMPGMSGVELLTQVARHDENIGRILLTGYADFEATTDSINLGHVHAYLTKPHAPEDIQMTVRSVLDRVELARENVRLVSDLCEKNFELHQTLDMLGQAQQRVVHSEQLAAIGRMIAMIVHDLRSPIAVIRSAGSEIVREVGEQPELSQLGSEILEEADHMQRMCADLLDTTRASEDGGTLLEDDLDAAVAAALASVVEEASRAGIQVDMHLDSNVSLPLNEDRLRRALRNLAGNAIDVLPEGGLLRVETRSEGTRVQLSMIDDGPGIPEEIRDRLFEPFVTQGKPGGSGLGLAVVKKVVEDHGGWIEANKPEGGGARFDLYFPIAAGNTSSA